MLIVLRDKARCLAIYSPTNAGQLVHTNAKSHPHPPPTYRCIKCTHDSDPSLNLQNTSSLANRFLLAVLS
jgi:hypothetical protein